MSVTLLGIQRVMAEVCFEGCLVLRRVTQEEEEEGLGRERGRGRRRGEGWEGGIVVSRGSGFLVLGPGVLTGDVVGWHEKCRPQLLKKKKKTPS